MAIWSGNPGAEWTQNKSIPGRSWPRGRRSGKGRKDGEDPPAQPGWARRLDRLSQKEKWRLTSEAPSVPQTEPTPGPSVVRRGIKGLLQSEGDTCSSNPSFWGMAAGEICNGRRSRITATGQGQGRSLSPRCIPEDPAPWSNPASQGRVGADRTGQNGWRNRLPTGDPSKPSPRPTVFDWLSPPGRAAAHLVGQPTLTSVPRKATAQPRTGPPNPVDSGGLTSYSPGVMDTHRLIAPAPP
ncbi:uncharacterized protein LOC119941305 [Tachyglossus aculeatus]|uniref:uncharacterized protein LOC119941305 n=1 Tax=Tachyglossus aculeatus TaxID=9261 RepID=UPI0018F2AEBF|nr:uncharacterized protein LOC119941305 [Tachyglossus aculeatus]